MSLHKVMKPLYLLFGKLGSGREPYKIDIVGLAIYVKISQGDVAGKLYPAVMKQQAQEIIVTSIFLLIGMAAVISRRVLSSAGI